MSSKNDIGKLSAFMYVTVFLVFIGKHAIAQDRGDFYQNWESVPQETDQRIGLKDTLISLGSAIKFEDLNLYEFAFLSADSKGNLAGFDFQMGKIVYFPHEDLSKIKFFGQGIGGGPQEFRNPYDIKFDNNGNIWLSDVDASRIMQWSPEGELLKTFPPNKKYVKPARIAVCSDKNIYVVSDGYTRDGIIHLLSLDGEHLNSFQEIKESLQRFPAYTEGEVTCHNNNLFFAGRFKNYIRKYDPKGKIIFSRSVQAFKPNKEPLIKRDGRFFIRSKDARRASGDLWTSDDKLFVGFSGNKDGWLRYLDVYNTKNGDYIRSYVFKIPVKEFTITNDRLYVIEWNYETKNKQLAVYKFPKIVN